MDLLWRDIHVALRGFRRSATFTVTAVLILGVGIGMAVAMWTVFNAVLLRRLPVREQERVVVLRTLDRNGVEMPLSIQEVRELRHDSRTLSEVSGFSHVGTYAVPVMDGDRQVVLNGAQVDGSFFHLLGARPVIGRLLQADDDDTTSHVMVLSYDAWQRQFGGDPSIVGHHLMQSYGEWTFTIVGVAPPGLDFPSGADYWEIPPFHQSQNVIARLAPDASPTVARTEFFDLVDQYNRRRDTPVYLSSADLRTLPTVILGTVRPALVLLTAAVGMLLVIACVNVGNLLLLRAASRSREFTIRRAVGASVVDVMRQLLVECTLMAGAGGVLGLGVAELARRALVAAAPRQLPRLDVVRVATTPVAAAVGVTILAVLVFGVLPSFATAARIDERPGSATRQRRRIRHALVASQVALAVIMLGGLDYFKTFGTPIVRGRPFLATDREDSPLVVIVSATIAHRYWPGENPIGKRMKSLTWQDSTWRTVVGVAGDAHLRSMRDPTPMVYLPWRQWLWQGVIAVRTSRDLAAMMPAIRHAIIEAAPRVTVWRTRTMDDFLDVPLAQPRLSALLLSAFGLVALALAAIGLYGIMASAVREQTRDIGVRMALGATPGHVRAEVLRRALFISLIGAGVGLACALAASRLLASLLFEVSPTDPVALLGACAVLLAVAAFAAYLPAYHASRVDPARALRSDA